MPEKILNETPSEICLSPKEWEEIGDCSMALYAAVYDCGGLQGDEPAELVKSVQMRFARAVHAVEMRLHGELRPIPQPSASLTGLALFSGEIHHDTNREARLHLDGQPLAVHPAPQKAHGLPKWRGGWGCGRMDTGCAN